jgi:acyl transferase domain-containing protein/NAD(P)H-dependent flavin oxidoreductase YrpB (nitropropane dioxygenase family)
MVTNIAITPEHCLDPQIAIAALRAGDWGILDLGYRATPETAAHALNRLAGAAGRGDRWGIRWDTLGSPERRLDKLSELIPRRVPILILAGLKSEDLVFSGMKPRELISLKKRVRRLARKVLIEVYDLPSAHAAAAAGCDGLILKGHEAGGWVSRHSSYILLQEMRGQFKIPYWLQGGISMRSAAAAVFAGAAGVVLREQLWLADESPFSDAPYSKAWHQLDGSETVLLGPEDTLFRLFSRSGRHKLQALEQAVVKNEPWQDLLRRHLYEADDTLIPMGQDIAFAGTLAARYGTVGMILAALRASIDSTLQEARSQNALSPDSPLARAHGTRFPIVQGPMTRVSDVAPFAKAVAEGGGLPFLALAVMRKPQIQALLAKTKALLGDLPWGVGILGFMPLELRQEQMDVIREVKPPFAIVAGGRPSQARELEALGIIAYLHVPSPGLLRGFVREGARKFIFEGSECGGHTGPRTSFILWESAIETLTTAEIDDPESVHVLFAGGIHDELSAAMVSILAAPLVARGMKVGVIMGTAYLFTKEIVNSGAVVEEFQSQAIACRETTLLQSGVGIYTRCAKTPFCDEFNRTRRELILSLESEESILKLLELLNIGRLRIASKGISHNNQAKSGDNGDRYLKVDSNTQRREGMYMLGEVARLKTGPLSISELHASVAIGSGAILAPTAGRPAKRAAQRANHDDIAIIGMSCLLPKAGDLRSYWQNILRGVDAIREVSDDRWCIDDFFDAKRGTPDKVYSKWGGFLDDVQFDPAVYGIPPASLKSIEPMQLLALEVARRALEDAGLDRRPFPKERTATIFASGGMNDLGTIYIFRTLLAHYLPKVPGLSDSAREQIMQTLYRHELPQWTEDSFPGFLGNVVAGRVANRLDLKGANFVVDAACASSLAALDVGIRQLRNRDADVALVGAIDGTNNAVAFMAFAQTHALSPRGRSRPFDDSADGIALGEGVAALVLKRLDDAERDGDRIYAVIKGIGSSSDGRNRSLTAPHPEGQVSAVRRAYDDAGVDPSTVGLIEAHGTGTAVGDKSEIESLNLAFGDAGMALQSCAVGSVKSMIGHTKVTAGLAGMIKAVLALKHQILPPTLGVEAPNSRVDFASTPFFVNTETRPWLGSAARHPRRSGVSAFGFGGTNFHVVLEEYTGGYRDTDTIDFAPRDAEPFTFWGPDRAHVVRSVQDLLQAVEHPDHTDLAQLAYSQHMEQRRTKGDNGARACRLALLATSAADLKQKLGLALHLLRDSKAEFRHPQGIYFQEGAASIGVCFLFPGQGSQKVNMLRDLVATTPDLHGIVEAADALLAGRLPQPLSRYIYPLPVFSDEERARQQGSLNATQVAQPALGVVELAALTALQAYGLAPDFVAGHSYGEYVALCAAGAIPPDELIRLSEVRGRLAAEAGQNTPGAMAAVDTDGARLAALIDHHRLDVSLANLNAPDQSIIAGSVEAIDAAAAILGKESLRVTKLAVSAAFHSPAMAAARDLLTEELAKVAFQAPRIPVASNTTGGFYPESAAEACTLLARHMTEPVRFVEQINHLYDAGARVFLEVGPGLVLSGLVDRILADRPHATLAIDAPGRPGWLQLAHLLTQAFALGLPLHLETWFRRRGLKEIGLAEVFAQARAKANPGPLIWRVNGGRAQPWRRPEAQPRPVPPAIVVETGAAAARHSPADPPTPATAPAAPVAHLAATRTKNRFLSRRRLSMSNNEASSTASPPAGSTAAGSEAQVLEIQRNLAQLIELQREQQETLRCFLDFQSNFIGLDLQAAAASAAEQAAAAQVPAAAAGSSRASLHTVPPAPVLPKQVLAAHAGKTAAEKVAPVVPLTTERAAAPKAEHDRPAESPPKTVTGSGGGLAPTETFKADLLRAVAERTGYPEDMLDLDAHMEADLGIDSIKRIEVFSGLKDRYDLMEGRDEEAVFEELSGLKTLNEIIGWYDKLRDPTQSPEGGPSVKKSQTPPSPSPAETVESATAKTADPVQCYAVKPVAAPAESSMNVSRLPVELPIVLLGSDSEVSKAFASALTDAGHTVQQIVLGKETRVIDDDRFEADLSSLESAQLLHDLLTNSGHTVGALVNLLGMTGCYRKGDESDHLQDAKALFLLLKVLEPEFREAGGGWLINLTSFDGQFGLSRSRNFPVGMAGTLGVAKSLAREWPGVRVKCIDVEPELETGQIVSRVLDEWRQQDAALEIGFTREGRWRLDLQQEGPTAADLSGLALDSQGVLLVTGGAYGITAEVSRVLAERYQPRLILVGRSPMPEPESSSTSRITDVAELKQFLIRDLRARNSGKVTPAEVDRTLKRVLKDREIRTNLAAMQASGAAVEYHAVDVRDADAFGSLIDAIYARWGRIDGVLHGAGIIDDKLIRDKPLESFEAVYGTKVIPAEVMVRKLRPETLKFLVFFSSIAGRFGNAGQCDYSAANEVLNKLADCLSHKWPKVHTLAINWGPWDSGMVSDEVLKLYASRNIRPIPLDTGTRYCLEKLQQPETSKPEIVITASLKQIAELQQRKRRDIAQGA